jgi:hypothetical protein
LTDPEKSSKIVKRGKYLNHVDEVTDIMWFFIFINLQSSFLPFSLFISYIIQFYSLNTT